MIQELRKKCPYLFLIVITIVMIFEYYVNFKMVWLDLAPSSSLGIVVYLLVYHALLFMLLWSLVKTMVSEPGPVPTYWGYFLEDSDNRVRKLCLKCFVYKPQRSHHCSTCQKCILNMDHHCPWINNCVGFYNRKPFILMLIYTTLLTVVQAIGMMTAFPTLVRHLKSTSSVGSYVSAVVIFAAFILNCIVLGTIVVFLKFHLELILKNSTTLETLESKKSGRARNDLPNYDIGKYYNWIQVFGKNYLHWPFPVFFQGEGPVGDGVVWPKKSDHLEI